MLRPDGPAILLVEDSDEDYTAMCYALERIDVRRPIERFADGEEALAHLRRTVATRPPALVILDLNLGGISGMEMLAELRGDPALSWIPVIVWTTSSSPRDVRACYAAGANCYLRKPVRLDDFERALDLLMRFWFGPVSLPASDPAPRGLDESRPPVAGGAPGRSDRPA